MGRKKSTHVTSPAAQEAMLVRAHSLGLSPNRQGVSQAESVEDDPFSILDPGEFIDPPIKPSVWTNMLTKSTRLQRCVEIMGRNIAGLGWDIVAGDEPGEQRPPSTAKKFEAEKAVLKAFFKRPNRDYVPTSRVLELMIVDRESSGTGYIEITRNNKGEIDGMYHIPGATIRVRKGGIGYVQVIGQARKYFKKFGDETVIVAKTGEPSKRALKPTERATELIQFKVYNPRSVYYGVPRWVPAVDAILGNALSASRNVNFFENDATPRMIITVSGGRLANQSMDMIEAFLRKEGKGVANSHRCLLLQADPKRSTLGSENKVMIEVQPLTVGTNEDASFLKYRSANDSEIREAFGITEPFFSTGDVNRAAAEVGRRITEDYVFEPERCELEFVINATICASKPFETEEAHFALKRPQPFDVLEQVTVDERLARSWAMTVDEMRAKHGYGPHPDPEIGKKPFRLLEAMASVGGVLGVPLPPQAKPGPKETGDTPDSVKQPPVGDDRKKNPKVTQPGTADARKSWDDVDGADRQFVEDAVGMLRAKGLDVSVTMGGQELPV